MVMQADINTEIVYGEHMEETKLKSHFSDFFGSFCKESSGRYISGILSPAMNARIGISDSIEEDMRFFRKEKVPFCWYVDQKTDSAFKQDLLLKNFHDLGVFKGMFSRLDHLFESKLATGCVIEKVESRQSMKGFASLVCPIFGLAGDAADQYEEALWSEPKIYNWVLKKDGKVVSALSTFIDGPVVSVWNVATDPSFRRQGYSKELWKEALNRAFLSGCRITMTYLTSEGMALGICEDLGYKTVWMFHGYLSPSENQESSH